MTSDLFDQLGQTLAQIGRLKEYLHSNIETSDGKVKITIKNTAPEAIDLPRVVFVGVGLSTSGVDLAQFNVTRRATVNTVNVTRSATVQKDTDLTRLHTEK